MKRSSRPSRRPIRHLSPLRPTSSSTNVLTLAPRTCRRARGHAGGGRSFPTCGPSGSRGGPRSASGRGHRGRRPGARLWRGFDPLGRPPACRGGAPSSTDARAAVGLAPRTRTFGGLSADLCLVGTFPQLEYPRTWPGHVPRRRPAAVGAGRTRRHPARPVTGRSCCWPPRPPRIRTTGCSARRCAACVLERVRVLGVWNGRPLARSRRQFPRTPVWSRGLSYARVMPEVPPGRLPRRQRHARALRWPRAVRCSPFPTRDDMPENAARLVWAGAGRRLPWPLLGAQTLRGARTPGRSATPGCACAQPSSAPGRRPTTGPGGAADLVEGLMDRTG